VPDISTPHPELVRDLLEQAGIQCGVEPRVLQGRDPDWTCIINGQTLSGDLYIHPTDDVVAGMGTTELIAWIVVGALVLTVLLMAIAILRMRRAAPPQPTR
jgi:hypothetical protein